MRVRRRGGDSSWQPPFPRSRIPSGVGGFGEAGFRATKRKEEKTNRKSPGAKHPPRKGRTSAGAGVVRRQNPVGVPAAKEGQP